MLPIAIAVDAWDNVFIADQTTNRIIELRYTIVPTPVSPEPPTNARLTIGDIVGIIIGVVVLLIFCILLTFAVSRYYRRSQQTSSSSLEIDLPSQHHEGDFVKQLDE
jgi:hypothetical protein